MNSNDILLIIIIICMFLSLKTVKHSLKLSANCYRGFSTPPSFNFLTDKPQPHHDLTFIRHAESMFNQACEDYRKTHNIPYVWKQLVNHQGFQESVLYNPKFMDCSLTQNGKNQCKKAQKVMADAQIDCVLVSPQLRALQTCQSIFGERSLPIYVEPLLVGPLRSCCDVNKPTVLKKAMFPTYDFSETENYQQLWYLDYLNPKQKQILKNHFEQNNIQNTQDQRVEIVRLLRQRKIFEDSITFRNRIQKIKSRVQEYKKEYKAIAIITHYYNVEYLGAIEYKEDGAPKPYIDIKNCTPYFASLQQILTMREEMAS